MKNILCSKLSTALILFFLLLVAFIPVLPLVKSQTAVHDLAVSLTAEKIVFRIDGKGHLSSRNSTVLNATVTNNGDFNESDAVLQLLINDTIVLSSTTPRLEANWAFWATYFWVPDDANYTLTVYAPPVSGEDNIADNNVTRWVHVCPDQPPIANFTYSPPPPPPGPIKDEIAIFNATNSSDPDWGTILNYTWDFGDGRFGEGVTVNHTYTTWGNKTVTLTLQDTENLTDSTSANITVYARPIANFTISGERFVNYTLIFNGTRSRDDDGNIIGYFWDFGDGTNNTGVITTHVYYDDATYRVNLTVTDNDGLSGSKSEWLIIGSGVPRADFEIVQPGPYYVDDTLTFNASKSKPDGGTIISYFWDWGDGTNNTTTDSLFNHTFGQPNIYNVTLIVTDSDNQTSLPTRKGVAVKLRVLLEVKPTPVWSNPGDYFNVSITVTNVVNLDYFEFTLNYTAGEPPPLLRGEKIYRGDFVLDEKTIADLQGQIRVNSTAHIGGVNGNFTLVIITFYVTNPGNCTLPIHYSLLKNSTVGNIAHTPMDGYFYTTIPVARFSQSTTSPSVNQTITFDASDSYDPDSPNAPNHGIVNYTWDFGDNTASITKPIPTINYSYTEEGTYTIKLTVTDDDGENWTTTHNKTVGFIHDVAVIDVKPWANETAGVLPINVTVKNEGTATETFNVRLYYSNITGSYDIETQPVTNLTQGSEKTLTFNWSIQNVVKGNYNITATATSVEGETDTDDNTYEDGIVQVFIAGDITRNGEVDIFDSISLAGHFGGGPANPDLYDPLCDLVFDGVIDMYDAIILASNFGRKDP